MPTVDEIANKYEIIADEIEDNPDWVASHDIDDRDLIHALRLAARTMRQTSSTKI